MSLEYNKKYQISRNFILKTTNHCWKIEDLIRLSDNNVCIVKASVL